MINTIKADILSNLDINNQKTVILHGCNCFHTMGSGIAKYLKNKFHQVYTADITQTIRGDRKKLGTFSTAVISDNLHILNCYTQYYYGRDNRLYAEYEAIEKCMDTVAERYSTWEIRLPKIGCGLAGGNWIVVEKIVDKTLGKFNALVYYK